MKKLVALGLAVLGLMAGLVFLGEDSAVALQNRLSKTDTHKFTLYPAPSRHDPYSLQYPITLDEPGLVSVEATVGGGKIAGDGSPFKIWIVEAQGMNNNTNRIEKKYIKSTERFKKNDRLSYPVDGPMLSRTKGKFVVLLSNYSPASHAVGTITITYPARDKTSSEGKVRHKRSE